jgi:hypothetical protein
VGLLLLVPGLVFLVNGTEWFPGEDTVGLVLAILGGVFLLIQIALWALVVWAAVRAKGD